MRRVAAAIALLAAAACGKKGDPLPPLPKSPARTTDLAVEQQGAFAVITFTFPSQRADGEPLRDLEEIDVYRLENAPPSLTSAKAAPAPAGGGPQADRAPIAGERRRAAAAQARERAFLESAMKIAAIRAADFAEASRGGELTCRDSLESALARTTPPREIAYAVVSRRRNGDRSEISNVATLAPVIPPAAPENLFAYDEADRICLLWSAPECDLAGREAPPLGYRVYRRRLEEDFGKPLNATPVEETELTDAGAAYGNDYVYTVTASARERPKSEGPPAIEFGIRYRDVFPPPPVAHLDALPEEDLVRLLWMPVEAPDLAGYLLERAENGGPWTRINEKPVTESSFIDRGVEPGQGYRYRIRSVDQAGNQSAPSPEAAARPYGGRK